MKNLDNIQFVTVDILDNKIINFLRRSGPVFNITVHVANYKFMVAHSFNLKVINYVTKEGEVILSTANIEAQKDVQAATRKSTTIEAPVVPEEPEEVVSLEEAKVSEEEIDLNKIALIDTISLDETDEVKVKVLPLEIYAARTKAELLDFLTTIESTLKDNTATELKDPKISKKHLLEIIEKEVVIDKL